MEGREKIGFLRDNGFFNTVNFPITDRCYRCGGPLKVSNNNKARRRWQVKDPEGNHLVCANQCHSHQKRAIQL